MSTRYRSLPQVALRADALTVPAELHSAHANGRAISADLQPLARPEWLRRGGRARPQHLHRAQSG